MKHLKIQYGKSDKTICKRHYYLDWSKVIAVLLLVFFHTARIFSSGNFSNYNWYVKNDVLSKNMEFFGAFVRQWHMPLFFLISGAATCFALGFRSGKEYRQERLKRLFIPFLFGTLVIVPPQVYYVLLKNPNYHDSYLQFYPHFFKIDITAHGYSGSFEWGHLWFILYLFVFSLIALPLFIFLKQAKSRAFISRLANFYERYGAIFLLALPLAIIEGALRPRWPGTYNLIDDWANFFLYFFYFTYGYLIYSNARLHQAIDRYGKTSLVMAFASMSVIFGLWWTNVLPKGGYSLGYVLYQVLRGFNSWFWVVALLYLSRKYLNFNNKLLQYANEAAYPFYILHQPVIVIVGFYVVRWNTGVFEKFLLISMTSIVVTIVLYDLLVKRINVLRFLFGMKPKKTR